MKNRGRNNKNVIQNVRVVDKDEGTDDIKCQRLLQAYNSSEGQIRVVCGVRQQLAATDTVLASALGFASLSTSDDFVSFTAQYREFRVRAIRFDIYDINAIGNPTLNYWATFHTIGGAINTGQEDVIDRPDSRTIAPGDGKTTLAWVAHSIPEMGFQAVDNFNGLGGLCYNVQSTAASTQPRYQIVAKFVVDFRART